MLNTPAGCSRATAPCNTCLNPFAPNNTYAFCMRNERLYREWCAREAAALRGGVSVEAARSAGVRFNSVGAQFDRSFAAADASQTAAVINSFVQVLLSGTRSSQPSTERVILKYDIEKHHRRTRRATAARDKLAAQHLNQHGFFVFDNSWGLQTAFGTKLKRGVYTALHNHLLSRHCNRQPRVVFFF